MIISPHLCAMGLAFCLPSALIMIVLTVRMIKSTFVWDVERRRVGGAVWDLESCD